MNLPYGRLLDVSGAAKSRDVDQAAWAILYGVAKDRKITQGQIGAAVGIADSQVSRYTRGIRASSADELYRAARFVGVDIGELLNRAASVASRAGFDPDNFDLAADEVKGVRDYFKGVPDEHLTD